MTAHRRVTITCDGKGCTRSRAGMSTASAVRHSLAFVEGWRVGVTGTDRITRDYCPVHR